MTNLEFQFLLHQDFGRTYGEIGGRVLLKSFSSFFIRTSAGHASSVYMEPRKRFSSFFIRTSAGLF